MKLTKEKRDKLMMVGLAAGFILVGVWQFLIVPQFQVQNMLRLSKEKTQGQLHTMENDIKSVPLMEKELAMRIPELREKEAGVGSGDPPLWGSGAFDLIRHTYTNVEFLSSSQVAGPETNRWSILPEFPYKQVSFSITGRAYFYDLGRFIADFENQFPTIRLLNLEVSAASTERVAGSAPGGGTPPPGDTVPTVTGAPADPEKLSFTVLVVALFKTDNS